MRVASDEHFVKDYIYTLRITESKTLRHKNRQSPLSVQGQRRFLSHFSAPCFRNPNKKIQEENVVYYYVILTERTCVLTF